MTADATTPGRVAMQVVESRVHARLFGAATRTTTIHRFRVLRPVGAGGMGVVFVAHDPELDRRVAIKLVARGRGSSSTPAPQRLRAEAQAMARLSHPNIVQVHDVGTHEGGIYIAMEYIDGQTLEHWSRGTPAPARPAILDAYVQAGRGLAAAHEAGIIHGDFKPSNAMIDRVGHVRVLDFGLAVELLAVDPTGQDHASLPATPALAGTPFYMAPELRLGAAPSARSDQYAFCVSLWRALHVGGTYRATVRHRTDLPRWLRGALQRGLAEDPAQRWPSLQLLVDALARGPARARRRGVLAAVVGGVLLASAVVGTRDEHDTAPDCSGFDRSAARAWDATHRDAVRGALHDFDDELAVGLMRALDRHAEELVAARTAACATDAGVGALQCLERMEQELASTVELVARSRATTIANASMAIAALGDPRRCDERSASEHEDPEVVALLAAATVSMRAGLVEDAYASATLACVRVADEHGSVQWARAQLQLGEALLSLGRHDEAARALEDAYLAALAHDRTTIAFDAAELAAGVGLLTDRGEEVERWLGNMRAAAARSQDPTMLVAIAVIEAELESVQNRYADAVAIVDELEGSGLLERTRTSRQLSTHLRAARHRGRVGDEAGAERELATATALAVGLPESHLLVNASHMIHGEHLLLRGSFEAALAEYRVVLALATRYRSPDDPMATSGSDAIAECLMRLGRLDEALAVCDENVRRAERLADGTRALPQALLLRGQIEQQLGRLHDAQRDASAALVAAQARGDADDVSAGAHVLLANVLRELGDLVRARSNIEEGKRELTRMLGPEHPETLGTDLVLAEIESAGGDHERAVELDLHARDGFIAALGPDHPHVAHACFAAGLELERAGHLADARVELERSLVIWRAALGDEAVDVRDAETALARIRGALVRAEHRR